MATNNTYQPEEEDLRLARYLNMGESDSVPPQDPLLPLLRRYKSLAELKVQAGAGERLHDRVEAYVSQRQRPAETPATGRRDRMVRLNSVWWRVAAILIAGSFLALLLLLTDGDELELLAESSDISRELTLRDGSRVVLRPYSSLHLISGSDIEQQYKIRGEVYFEVETRPERLFVVHTEQTMVRVTATRFTLSTWGGHTRVYLDQGAVAFSREDGTQEVTLSPGQASSVRDGIISEPEITTGANYLGWLRGELVLDRRPLSDIIREIRHHFNVTVALDPALNDEELSGTLVLDDPDRILHDLAISVGAGIEQLEPDHYRIFEDDSL
ncbi:MAG: FecR domain-containing protein [Balneolales bacterium]